MIAEQKWSKLNDYTPDFLNLNDTLIFTGIKGELLMKVEVQERNENENDDWDSVINVDISKKGDKGKTKAIDFDLIPGFTINFDKQPVFDQQLIKNIIQ